MTHLPTNVRVLLHLLDTELPVKGDVAVWLQGDRFDRAKKTLSLYRDGFVPHILLTGNDKLIGPTARVGEDNVGLVAMREWLVMNGAPDSAIETDDQAFNTRDQAVNAIQRAKARGWTRILLVGSPCHQPRAFLTFLQQAKRLEWNGRIVNCQADLPWDVNPSGRPNTAREVLDEELAKIERYGKDVASISEGVEYLQHPPR